MPNYEYECGSCGGRFEVLQKFSDPVLTMCKICNAKNLRKVLSPTSFVLKGNGWYATDYASQDRKSADAGVAEKPKEEAKQPAGCPGGNCSGVCPSKG
ncbi:MAG TPA: zinc ribbon domain-containing protein [Nitrospirota bacterium]|nr:zinc ribbon domain-containing protein [Nitrospirota bacterium]